MLCLHLPELRELVRYIACRELSLEVVISIKKKCPVRHSVKSPQPDDVTVAGMLLICCEQSLEISSSITQHTSLTCSCFLYHCILLDNHPWNLLHQIFAYRLQQAPFITTIPTMPRETHCFLCLILLSVMLLQKL